MKYEKKRQLLRKTDPIERAKKARWDRLWIIANRDRKNTTNRLWKTKNLSYRLREAERLKRRREENREEYNRRQRMYGAKRRAYKKEGVRRFGNIDERLINNYYTRICGICELIIENKYEIDHLVPLSRNGSHTLDNLQLVHPRCNRTKHRRLQKEMGLDIMLLRELVS